MLEDRSSPRWEDSIKIDLIEDEMIWTELTLLRVGSSGGLT
jgi:hypothetical protein